MAKCWKETKEVIINEDVVMLELTQDEADGLATLLYKGVGNGTITRLGLDEVSSKLRWKSHIWANFMFSESAQAES